jgi:hypothetical protein
MHTHTHMFRTTVLKMPVHIPAGADACLASNLNQFHQALDRVLRKPLGGVAN